METREAQTSAEPLSNAEIADRLAGLAQLLSTQKENPYKVKAYHRAAARIRTLSESLDELVREEADLTRFPGIGAAIASATREIVLTGTLKKLDRLRGQAPPEVASLADYPDDLLRELDYTVCSIHSRFGLNREQQTERIMRAMDSRYFNILGHATGRLLLKRPGYGIDMERVIAHAKASGCFFEINSSPDRLDLSADNARRAAAAGILIAVNTDSHSMGELALVRCGLDQARRAGLEKTSILNCQSLETIARLFRR